MAGLEYSEFGTMLGDPIIEGALHKTLIDRVIKQRMNVIRYCYRKEQDKIPGLSGEVTIAFEIASDGTVAQSTTYSSTLNNQKVQDCMQKSFLRMRFPSPSDGGTVQARYRFAFNGSQP